MKKFIQIVFVIASFAITIPFISYQLLSPQTNRAWSEDQSVMPTATFNGDEVTISNVRNFQYDKNGSVTKDFYDKSYNLSEISFLDLSLSTLPVIGGAHPILLFGFENGDRVAISIEARREEGETYSAFKGILPMYETIFVIADEQDAIGRRLIERDTATILYPLNVSKEFAQKLFISLLERANSLTTNPEFYNTLTHNCVNNLVREANTLHPGAFPAFHIGTVFPKYADTLLYKQGYIETDLSLEEARAYFTINKDRAI